MSESESDYYKMLEAQDNKEVDALLVLFRGWLWHHSLPGKENRKGTLPEWQEFLESPIYLMFSENQLEKAVQANGGFDS